jgi:hypothetical protein
MATILWEHDLDRPAENQPAQKCWKFCKIETNPGGENFSQSKPAARIRWMGRAQSSRAASKGDRSDLDLLKWQLQSKNSSRKVARQRVLTSPPFPTLSIFKRYRVAGHVNQGKVYAQHLRRSAAQQCEGDFEIRHRVILRRSACRCSRLLIVQISSHLTRLQTLRRETIAFSRYTSKRSA